MQQRERHPQGWKVNPVKNVMWSAWGGRRGKKVQFTSCSCCLLPYCKWCNGNASAHSSFSFLGCMRETHANYDGTNMRQLKIHAASWREVSARGALPDCTMQRTKRNREAECGGKSNASTSWTELAFLFSSSLFLKPLQAETCVAVSHVRGSHAVITVC